MAAARGALCCRGRAGGEAHAALHTMLGAWTLSSKQWGVTEKQCDGNCTVERLLWGQRPVRNANAEKGDRSEAAIGGP